MEKINAITFGFMSKRGEWSTKKSSDSLRLLKDRTAANAVILPVVVTQATPFVTTIDWQADTVLSDAEVLAMAKQAQDMGLRVILKPMVNVADGTWRAMINFFDHSVPCEPSWEEWFLDYNAFLLHYAALAEQMKAEMLVIGCEMVNTDRREAQWRALIHKIRGVYHGLLTYNCDKYQEDALRWWDAVDVISSSGYYPYGTWDKELDRIEQVVQREQKPFFFCEAGCPSRQGAETLPNSWERMAPVDSASQAKWYTDMFAHTAQRKWVQGYGLWDWKANLYPVEKALENDDYALYGKPSEKIVKSEFEKFR